MSKSNSKLKMEVPYFQVPNDIFNLNLDKHEILVYFYLARCSNQGSKAFPSYNTIAKKCKVSRRTAISAIKNLESKGILSKETRYNFERGEHCSNTYVIKHDFRGSAEYALGSVSDALGGEYHAPNKEIGIKELEKKKREYIILPNDGRFLTFYLKALNTRGMEHKKVSRDNYEYIMTAIDSLENMIDYEEWTEAVKEHLSNLPAGNDGSIMPFLKASSRHFEARLTEGGQEY